MHALPPQAVLDRDNRAASTATVTLDRSRAAEARDDPTIPWLTVVLLMIAGVGIVQTRRLRPGFGA